MPFSVVRGKVIVDNTGASQEMPVLMTPNGPLRPLIDYCLSKRRSLDWQKKLLRANKLFLEYLEVNAIAGEEEWRLFRNFGNALRQGTIDPETHEDPIIIQRIMHHCSPESQDVYTQPEVHEAMAAIRNATKALREKQACRPDTVVAWPGSISGE